mmetsp:Transcript_34140/g.55650  ORF Transcript_34140/g.55650 Transcript_34140/m.55650 type:complete len:202 (+) Transcript_34140:14-619(+)
MKRLAFLSRYMRPRRLYSHIHRPSITQRNSIHRQQRVSCLTLSRRYSHCSFATLRSSRYHYSSTARDTPSPPQQEGLPFIITDASVKRLDFLKQKRNETDLLLRIAVSSGGCSGFQYEFELSNMSDIDQDEDLILTQNNAQFVVDKTSLKFIKGAKLDFVEDFIQRSFVIIDNPNIVSECGCNVSFAPNPDLLNDDEDAGK